jgi:putative redox protein
MPMEVTAYWEGGFRVRVPLRHHELRMDEPPRFGGDDTGPMPTEMFLASLTACFTLAVRHVARKDGFEPPDLAVRADAEYDGLRLGRIRVEVISSDDRVRDTIARAVPYCYVSNTLREPPEMEYVMAEEPVSHEPPPQRG